MICGCCCGPKHNPFNWSQIERESEQVYCPLHCRLVPPPPRSFSPVAGFNRMNYHKSPFHANLQRSSVRPSAAVTLDHKEHKKYVLKLAKRGSDKLYPFDSIFRLFNGLVSHPRKRSINLFGKHCNNPLTHNNIHPSSAWILYREMILCAAQSPQ